LSILGCGHPKGTVSGIVTYKDKPLPGGFITFVPEQGSGSYSGKIQQDGSYRVADIPAGPVKIGVQAPQAPKHAESMISPVDIAKGAKPGAKGAAPASGTTYVNIPPSYSDPEKSGLRLTVTGGSQEHNIPLK
jgi:hypothetical protein